MRKQRIVEEENGEENAVEETAVNDNAGNGQTVIAATEPSVADARHYNRGW